MTGLLTNPDVVLRNLMLRQPALVELVGTRLYMSSELPAGYSPTVVLTMPAITGPAIQCKRSGGPPNPTDVLLDLTYQVLVYGNTVAVAEHLDRVVFQALHNQQYQRIRKLRCNTTGQHIPDPNDLGWHTYLSVWSVLFVIG